MRGRSLGGFLRVRCLGGFLRGLVRDLRHLDARQRLTVPGAPFVAALGLELEHPQLLAADVAENLRRDRHLMQGGLLEDHVVRAVEHRLEGHVAALGRGEALDEQALALLDAVLLSAALDYRVHVDVLAA